MTLDRRFGEGGRGLSHFDFTSIPLRYDFEICSPSEFTSASIFILFQFDLREKGKLLRGKGKGEKGKDDTKRFPGWTRPLPNL